jgi:predicted small secreted protein
VQPARPQARIGAHRTIGGGAFPAVPPFHRPVSLARNLMVFPCRTRVRASLPPPTKDTAMNTLLRKSSALALLALLLASLSACNTIEGVGKDVQEVGEEVEEAADETKN